MGAYSKRLENKRKCHFLALEKGFKILIALGNFVSNFGTMEPLKYPSHFRRKCPRKFRLMKTQHKNFYKIGIVIFAKILPNEKSRAQFLENLYLNSNYEFIQFLIHFFLKLIICWRHGSDRWKISKHIMSKDLSLAWKISWLFPAEFYKLIKKQNFAQRYDL